MRDLGGQPEAVRARRLKIGAVVLAAGSASRMGHRPKCLLELDGQPLIERLLHALTGLDERVVVLGHHAPAIERALDRAAASTGLEEPSVLGTVRVYNWDPQAAQVTSQRLGLRALPDDLDAVLVALADQPLIGQREITDLIDAYRDRPAGMQVVQPAVAGLPGNPVIFSALVRQEILAAAPDVGCRQWQAAHPQQVHAWNTDNPSYRTDVDTPEDVSAFTERTGRRLLWPIAQP